jgi:hypothetical protein
LGTAHGELIVEAVERGEWLVRVIMWAVERPEVAALMICLLR